MSVRAETYACVLVYFWVCVGVHFALLLLSIFLIIYLFICFFRNLTLKPHHASSSRNEELAENIKHQWTSYGFDVKFVKYNVLLSFPEKGKINGASLLDANGTVKFITAKTEEVVEPSENSPDALPPFSAYSPTGKAKVMNNNNNNNKF